jgi:hypothetical protein
LGLKNFARFSATPAEISLAAAMAAFPAGRITLLDLGHAAPTERTHFFGLCRSAASKWAAAMACAPRALTPPHGSL